MGQHPVRRIIAEAVRRHGDAALRQDEELADGLGDRGFAAPVGAGQDIDPLFRVKGKIVGHGGLRAAAVDQLQVIEPLRRHARGAVFFRAHPGLAEAPAGFFLLFDIFRPAGIEDQLRNQVRHFPDADVQVPGQGFPQLSGDPGGQHGGGAVHLPRDIGAAVRLRNPGQGHGRQRIAQHDRRLHKLVDGFEQADFRVGRIEGGAAVPVRFLPDLVPGVHGSEKILQQAGLREGFSVHGDQAHIDGLKPVVQVDAHRQATDLRRGQAHLLHVLFQRGEALLPVHLFHPVPQGGQPFRDQILFRQALPDGFHGENIVVVFLQAVHQVPDAGFVSLVTVDHAVIVEHLNPVQKLHQALPDLRMAQDVLEDVAAESGHAGIRGQAHHHPAEQGNLLRLGSDPFRQRVQAEIVPGFLRDFPVGDFILIREKNAEGGLFHGGFLVWQL